MKLRLELSCLAVTKKRVRYVFHSTGFMALTRVFMFLLLNDLNAVPNPLTAAGTANCL